MTYFGFLAIFILPFMLLFGGLNWILEQRGRRMPSMLSSWPVSRVILAHVLVALIYTTPWDNYLVATSVWWYDPALVTGLTIGFVPIEEYTFFVVQTLTVGAFMAFLMRLLYQNPSADQLTPKAARLLRWGITLALTLPWIWSVTVLATGWQPGNYLALILVWALPPVMLQTFFGADILWKHRRVILITLLTATLYLSAADMVAIQAGTWVISPEKTLGIKIAGILPIEEAMFFLMTNVLITLGMTLVLAEESQQRVPKQALQTLVRIFRLGNLPNNA